MKLLFRITSRISVAMLVLFAVWAAVFYYIVMEEISDETDDSLDSYSEYIIKRALAGEELPERDNGTNNSYYITEVDREYADSRPYMEYLDQDVYIYSMGETEPARVLRTVFVDAEDRYYELTVSIPSIEKDDLQRTILWWMIGLYVVLLIAIIVVNALVLRRSLKPLYKLLDWIDGLVLGRDIPPFNVETNITEFRRLNDAVLRSARRNADMYEQQSLFIGNASHELQTPLAVCLNRLEILSDDPSLSEMQLEQLFRTRDALNRIVKLNKTLLMLTKIENGQVPESVAVDVNGLIAGLAADFREAYSYTGIRMIVENDAPLNLNMNESLASVLFGNLLKNAVIHSGAGAEVRVMVGRHGVAVSNSASGSALDPDHIFRRFYQGTKKEGSLGLGLSLAESICRYYGMRIGYSCSDGMHRFAVSVDIADA